MFYVGQKVICINDDGFEDPRLKATPVKNGLYVIRDIFEFETKIGVRLIEIKNPLIRYRDGRYEPSFHIWRFRPVTDISIFTSMLKDEKINA